MKLAGISLPLPSSRRKGKAAKEFAESLLMNRVAWLDIDDRSGDGRDPLGSLLCVVYMKRPDGGINLTHPLNKILVDEGFAEIDDSEDDEFDPKEWWPLWIFINEVKANPPPAKATRTMSGWNSTTTAKATSTSGTGP